MKSAGAILACLAVLLPDAFAHDLPGGAQLGMGPQQLQQAVPGVQPTPHPVRLAGGLVGSWSGGSVGVAGVALTPTFFLADGQLRRIEYLAADASPQAFDALLQWGRAQYGAEAASAGPEGQYATWSDNAADVYLQRTNGPRAAQLRLVVKQRVLKDASEL